MLDQVDLVHMNGRIYDPYIGRVLSGDRLVQDPLNGQSYNRFSYVQNNPTNVIDPTGFYGIDPVVNAIVDVSGKRLSSEQTVDNFAQVARTTQQGGRVQDPVIGKMQTQQPARSRKLANSRLLDQVDQLFAQTRRGILVGAIPFIGQDLAEDFDDPLKVIDPYQAAADAVRAANDEKYLEAGIGVLATVARPTKAAEPLVTGGVVITEKGLALVEQNLARFERYGPNEAMVQSLRTSMEQGVRAFGADAQFYLHEIAENTQRLKGLGYEAAHEATLIKYRASEYMLYSEKVIRQYSSEFNNNFRKFWGIK
jgi:RHS repeat-associated protein